jgi:hypothetical protein
MVWRMSELGLASESVEDAYVWGLPILGMYRYSVGMADQVGGYNKLTHTPFLFEPGAFPGGPNRDTLYSYGWFDLDDGPYVVSLPSFGDRYFVWQMTDVYEHNFHNVGNYLLEGPTDEYGSGYTFLLAGRGWNGEAPEGMDVVRAPVRLVNVLYRIQAVSESDDIGEAVRLQNATVTMPLSEWKVGTRESVQVEPSSPVPGYRDVIAFGQGVTGSDQRNPEFFSALADVMSFDPPYTSWDQEIYHGPVAALGADSNRTYDFDSFDASTQAVILDAQERGFDKVMALRKGGFGLSVNGWQFGPAHHGNNDQDGGVLDGTNTYTLRFSGERLPPATNFWSVTAYEAGTNDLYPNDAGLYMVGSNNPNTKYADDGSVDIIFSHQQPDNQTANWLPVPNGPFWAIIRFYAPTPEILSGDYQTPGIVKTN